MKCEALVHSRMNKETLLWSRLPDWEPCGAEAVEYEVRASEVRKEDNAAQLHVSQKPMAAGKPLGSIVVKTSLCDRHKKKALREGKELIPVGTARPGILTHIDTN